MPYGESTLNLTSSCCPTSWWCRHLPWASRPPCLPGQAPSCLSVHFPSHCPRHLWKQTWLNSRSRSWLTWAWDGAGRGIPSTRFLRILRLGGVLDSLHLGLLLIDELLLGLLSIDDLHLWLQLLSHLLHSWLVLHDADLTSQYSLHLLSTSLLSLLLHWLLHHSLRLSLHSHARLNLLSIL